MNDRQRAGSEFDELREVQRRTRLKWALIAGGLLAVSALLFVAFAEYRVFFFRPKPDMKEVERVALAKTNDPACRALVDHIDQQQSNWTSRRVDLRKIDQSSSLSDVRAAREEIHAMVVVYDLEERRLETIVVRDPNVRGDMNAYLKQVLRFLKRMDALLTARATALEAPPPAADAGKSDAGGSTLEVPGLGQIKLAKPDAGPAAASEDAWVAKYQRAWSVITEDQDKWRVFRQGPIPCGRREGKVPPIPAKARDLLSRPSRSTPVKLAPPK